mgnify:CR=1 FL=1|tara:strand:+ start:4488 stop:5021 length:534 start_codon:yes stop_codon:yes gene_type:complete
MKIKLFVSLFVVLFCLSSCKKEVEKAVKVDPTKELFKVSLHLLIQKNDTLHLYYGQDMAEDYTEEHSIWLPVEGKEIAQKVIFLLPEAVLPVKLRIDFGVNRKNEEIVLNTVAFDYFDKNFVANDSTIFNYFRPDESTTSIDYTTRTLKRKDPNSVKGASLYPHDEAVKTVLEQLIK